VKKKAPPAIFDRRYSGINQLYRKDAGISLF
jgi:hypothetical protein